MALQIIIPGAPIAKARHRSMVRNGVIFNYDSQEQIKKAYKLQLIQILNSIEDSKDRNMFEMQQDLQLVKGSDSFEVDILFCMPIPKTVSKKKAPLLLNGQIKHDKKPDCDNLLKMILDVGNGILWPDDRQIFRLNCEKRYSENPCTIVSIEGYSKQEEI